MNGDGTVVTGHDPPIASYRLSVVAHLRLKKGDRVVSEAQLAESEDYLPARPQPTASGAGHITVTASTLSDFEKSKRGGTPESPGMRQ